MNIIRGTPSTANGWGMRPKRSTRPFPVVFIYFALNSLPEATSVYCKYFVVSLLELVTMTHVWNYANCA